jgi:hypothetical protein
MAALASWWTRSGGYEAARLVREPAVGDPVITHGAWQEAERVLEGIVSTLPPIR